MDGLSWFILADPCLHETVQRYEGVGRLLDHVIATVWRNSGERLRTISSRIVSIRIQLKGCTFCGVNRHNGNICLTEISVYVE